MKKNLETYMFNFGSKGKLLRKVNSILKTLAKTSARLCETSGKLMSAERFINEQSDEIDEIHMKTMQPILDMIGADSDIVMETRTCYELDSEEFMIRVRTPRVRIMDNTERDALRYRCTVAKKCCDQLAEKITDHVYRKIAKGNTLNDEFNRRDGHA